MREVCWHWLVGSGEKRHAMAVALCDGQSCLALYFGLCIDALNRCFMQRERKKKKKCPQCYDGKKKYFRNFWFVRWKSLGRERKARSFRIGQKTCPEFLKFWSVNSPLGESVSLYCLCSRLRTLVPRWNLFTTSSLHQHEFWNLFQNPPGISFFCHLALQLDSSSRQRKIYFVRSILCLGPSSPHLLCC